MAQVLAIISADGVAEATEAKMSCWGSILVHNSTNRIVSLIPSSSKKPLSDYRHDYSYLNGCSGKDQGPLRPITDHPTVPDSAKPKYKPGSKISAALQTISSWPLVAKQFEFDHDPILHGEKPAQYRVGLHPKIGLTQYE